MEKTIMDISAGMFLWLWLIIAPAIVLALWR
jgi:hypothetical protein